MDLTAGPSCPPELAYLLGWFRELHAARGSSGFAPNPICYGDFAAWCMLTARRPGPVEVSTLVLIDRVYLKVMTAAEDG